MDLSGAAAAWRRDGFVVLPGYLDGPELKAAQRDLPAQPHGQGPGGAHPVRLVGQH
jgi:hypothetical protein